MGYCSGNCGLSGCDRPLGVVSWVTIINFDNGRGVVMVRDWFLMVKVVDGWVLSPLIATLLPGLSLWL